MLCPRCQTETEAYICPKCSLDFKFYSELTALRREVATLRQFVQPSTAAKVQAPEPAPPPLTPVLRPAGVPSPVPPIVSAPKSRASTEVAVGQKWFLGIGVFVLLLAAGFFLKYAFDEKWIGPAVQVTLGFVAGAVLFEE